MVLTLAQGAQQRGNLGHAGGVERRANQVLQLDVLVVFLQSRKAVLLMHHADDVIDCVMVDRQTGIAALGKALDDLVHRGIVLDGDHIHAGGQHVLGLDVVKLDGTADQLAFAIGQLAVLLGFADHRDQLAFGDGVLFSGIKPFGKELFPRTEQGVQRRKNRDQRTEHRGKGHGQGFGHFFCHALGGDLAESQDQQGHDDRGDRGAVYTAHQAGKQHGGKRGRTDVHDIVSNQNGAEQAVIALDQGQRMGGFLVTIIRFAFQANLVQRIVRCFGR